MTCPPTSITQESDAFCLYNNRSIKRDFKDKKDSEVKKTPITSINHNNSKSGLAS